MVGRRLREEVKRGIQTIQYQVVTLLTTNGQAPIVTVFMYLGEAKNDQERDDLALVIEEVLRQRYEGVKNEKGVWVTPAFPKLILNDPGSDSIDSSSTCVLQQSIPLRNDILSYWKFYG